MFDPPFRDIWGSSERACSTGSDTGPCLLRKFGWRSYMGRSTKETGSRSGVAGRQLERQKGGWHTPWHTHLPQESLDIALCMSFSVLVDISTWNSTALSLTKRSSDAYKLISHFVGILIPRCLPTRGGGKELVALLPKEAHLNHLNVVFPWRKVGDFVFNGDPCPFSVALKQHTSKGRKMTGFSNLCQCLVMFTEDI